jgi:dTDP-6-deoxy-L-talose 4-dehydrogenase (NAD+)
MVHDLTGSATDCWQRFGQPDAVIHLAWDQLGDYRDLAHIEHTLGAHYTFLKQLVAGGVVALTCAGTCFEYGAQFGPVSEAQATEPNTPYAIAKDSLRRFLECLLHDRTVSLSWLRLFYMYGDGQRPSSLLGQLDRALDEGDSSFPMSPGEQLRDYLAVERVAEYIVKLTLQQAVCGPINVCSGVPMSVRSLVEKRIQAAGSSMALGRGQHPYAEHEPLAFWGDDRRLRRALAAYDSEEMARSLVAPESQRSGPVQLAGQACYSSENY